MIAVKRLWLLRHAKSSWDDPASGYRQALAPRGQRATELLAAHLAASDIRPATVLCSSSLRTRETLAAILPALGDALEIHIERELYGAGRQHSWNGWARAEQGVLGDADGHNPGIQDLALQLATTGPALAALREKFPTGALATVEIEVERWRDVTDGKATATGLVTPRSLETGREGE